MKRNFTVIQMIIASVLVVVYGFSALNSLITRNAFLMIGMIFLYQMIKVRKNTRTNEVFVAATVLFVAEVISAACARNPVPNMKNLFWDVIVYTVIPAAVIPFYLDSGKKIALAKAAIYFSMLIGSFHIINQAFHGIVRGPYVYDQGFQFFAALAVLFLPLPLVGAFDSARKKNLRVLDALVLAIVSAAFLLNGMRGQWIAFFVQIVVFLVMKRKKMQILVLAALVVVFAIAAMSCQPIRDRLEGTWYFACMDNTAYNEFASHPERLNEITGPAMAVYERVKMLETGWQAIKDYPLFGIGSSNYNSIFIEQYWSRDKHWYASVPHLHNSFLQQALVFGGFGLIALLASLSLLYRYFWTHKNVCGSCSMMGILVVTGFVFSGMSDNVLGNRLQATMFWLVVSLLCACINVNKRINQDEERL